MKSLFLLSAATFIALSHPGTAQVPGVSPAIGNPNPPPDEFRVELLIVRLPEAKAIALRPELLNPKISAAAQDKLLAMVKAGEAELVDWPLINLEGNGSNSVQNVHEMSFANGFEMPFTLTDTPVNPTPAATPTPSAPATPAASATPPTPAAPAAPNGTPKEKDQPASKPPAKIIGGVPMNIQSRTFGVTFEAQVSAGPQPDTVSAVITATHTTFSGYHNEKVEVTGLYTVVTPVPDFQTETSRSYFTLRSGEPRLLGFHTLHQPEKTVEIMLVTGTILPPAPPAK